MAPVRLEWRRLDGRHDRGVFRYDRGVELIRTPGILRGGKRGVKLRAVDGEQIYVREFECFATIRRLRGDRYELHLLDSNPLACLPLPDPLHAIPDDKPAGAD